jgi:hypothetical protein
MKGLIIDGQIAGASGDMFLGALLALCYSNEEKDKAIKKQQEIVQKIAAVIPKAANLPEAKIAVSVESKNVRALQGIGLKIDIREPHRHLHAPEAFRILENVISSVKLSKKAQEFCRKVLDIIFDAEAKAHGTTREKTHLHEAGSLDTFLDIVGAGYLLDFLNLLTADIFILPVALGSGEVTFSHGTLPVPVPAVTTIVQQYQLPTRIGSIESELLTPTGAAILAAFKEVLHARSDKQYPPMTIEKIGIGLGSKEFDKSPNALRLLLGELSTSQFAHEVITVVETNIDDCSGETIGYITKKLMELGAKDVYLTPIFMKKGRPGTKISILCSPDDELLFASEIIKETSTIGVRISRKDKIMLTREIKQYEIEVKGKKWPFQGKIAYDKQGNLLHFKAEFDDIEKIAHETKLPLTKIIQKTNELLAKDLEREK